MNRGVALFASLMPLLGGCSHRAVLRVPGPADEFRAANGVLAGRSAEVRTQDGQIHNWFDVKIAADSMYGLIKDATPERASVATTALAEITVKRHGRGALEGLAIGLVAAGVLGFAVGPNEDDDCFACPRFDRGEVAALSAAGGALWGLAIGAIRGARYHYSFERRVVRRE